MLIWRALVVNWLEQPRLSIVSVMPSLALGYLFKACFADRAFAHNLTG